MKRNGLDIMVLILGIACVGLLTVNRYIFRPVWNSEFRTELRETKNEIKAGLTDSRNEIKESSKEVKKELKVKRDELNDEMKDAKNEMKEVKDEMKESLSLSY